MKLKAFSWGRRFFFFVKLFKGSPNSNYIFMKPESLHETAISEFDVWLKWVHNKLKKIILLPTMPKEIYVEIGVR